MLKFNSKKEHNRILKEGKKKVQTYGLENKNEAELITAKSKEEPTYYRVVLEKKNGRLNTQL